MRPYDILAEFYDELISDVDYSSRVDYLQKLFIKHNYKASTVLDLACGTGNITFELVKRGFDVIGVDFSEEMLTRAAQKSVESGCSLTNPLFVCQDMRCLELAGKVSCAVCVLDGINHLGSLQSVKKTFESVSLYLERDGLFVFDLNTPYKIKNILGNNTFVYDYDDVYCVWENSYNEKTARCRFDLTFFERDGEKYLRSDESFYEKAYTTAQVKNRLESSGMKLEAVYADMSFAAAKEKSERLIYVARKL